MKRILVLGGTGMLGRPVVRRLVKEGFTIRAMVRNPEKAKSLLPPEAEMVPGDLQDLPSLRKSAEGREAVYMNLATDNPKSAFKPELDGTKNVIEALKDHKDILIAKISALGVGLGFTAGDWREKKQAEEAIIASGHPYLIFRLSWFMESLPLFLGNVPYSL